MLTDLDKKIADLTFRQRDEIARLQNQVSQLIGNSYPSRAVVEYALKTQTGSTINLKKASTEFFDNIGE